MAPFVGLLAVVECRDVPRALLAMGKSVSSDAVLREIQQRIEERLSNWPEQWQGYHWPGYTLQHTYRVRDLALTLGGHEHADAFVLEAAALLHDIAKPSGDDHALKGAEEAERILLGMGLDKATCSAISSAVATHVGTAGEEDPVENRILADADYIDANFGLIAVWRYITIRGHRRDPLAVQVAEMGSWLEKRSGAVAELGMVSGREVGADRFARMRRFCSGLGKEHEAGRAGPRTWLWQRFTDGAELPDVQASIEGLESADGLSEDATVRTFVSELRSEISGRL